MSADLDLNIPEHGIPCVCCGGRGGWWSGEFREQCQRCERTGWEPSEAVRRAVKS